jgi:phosphate transport system permease protein
LGAPTGLTAFTGSLILAYMALAHDHQHWRGCALCCAQRVSRWGVGDWGDPVANDLACGVARGALGAGDRLMLGIGRAIGETMAVMMVTGNAANIPGWAAASSSSRCAR